MLRSASSSVSGKKREKAMPMDLQPMLATLTDKPSEEKEWLYELKWDGFRAISYLNHKSVEIKSRNNKSFNQKFYPIYNALKKWKVNAIVDGEIIVVSDKGHPDFEALQTWRSEADGDLVYYLFDLLWLNGKSLMNVPLVERRELLEKLIPDDDIIRNSELFQVKGKDLFNLTKEMSLEGIIGKRANSVYKPGARSKDWVKIKAQKHQEAVIAGYTKNENTSRKFSSLILGIYEDGELIPIAPVGTGFTAKMQDEILRRLKPLETKKCPFKEIPDFNKPSRFRPNPPRTEVVWVKPKIVAEISYRTVSSDGSFRHPSFRGLRDDKNPKQVVREQTIVTGNVKAINNPLTKNKLSARSGAIERKTLLNPSDQTQVRKVNNHELKFTNLNKIFWPKSKVTKRDMINYYYQITPYILPYLSGRPQTLNRFPNGIDKPSFYQKDVKGKVPSWIHTYTYYSEADEREKEFLVMSDESSLLYTVNLGCIEINPWSSTAKKPDHPDWCIIDLDPDKNPFDKVVEAALVTKDVLDEAGIPSYCKTSGSTGLHIYIPLGAKYTYEESKEFARIIVKIVHAKIPEFTSIERLTSKRKGKLYLDFLQNRPQATVAAPYSLRPKPNATVSMPLHWNEVKKGLKMEDFTIHNAVKRVKEQGDIFKDVLGKGINMDKALKKLNRMLNLNTE